MPEGFQLSRKKGSRMRKGGKGVARPSPFGNPFTVADAIEAGYEDPQRACVAHFEAWVDGDEAYQDVYVVNGRRYDRRWIREHLDDLRGKDLGCWCPLPEPGEPDICHRAVLLKLSNDKEATP